MLNLKGSFEKIESQLIGNKHIPNKEKLLDEIKTHSGFYEKLPKECHDLLSRLELMGKHEEVLRYYHLWMQYVEYFNSVSNILKSGSHHILMLEKTALKVDKTKLSLSFENIITGLLQNNEIGFKLNESFLMGTSLAKGTHHTPTRILIFEKVD